MATSANHTYDGTWQSVGAGVITFTSHNPGGLWAVGASTPAGTVQGHRLEEDVDKHWDTGSDNLYVKGPIGGTGTVTV